MVIEVWKDLGDSASALPTTLFNIFLETEKTPYECRKSITNLIYKNNGDVQNCVNYIGIRLVSHIMKMEWVREEIEISQVQFDFMLKRRAKDAIFSIRMAVEIFREGQEK